MSHITKCFGPPGTGKTTFLMGAVAREHSGGVPMDRIAYLSFSKAAKEVIKGRLALKDKDVIWFRTIHGAAFKSMALQGTLPTRKHYKEFSENTGMTITQDDADAEFNPGDYNICMRAVTLAANMMVTVEKVIASGILPDHPNLGLGTVESFKAAWHKFKAERGLFDFTDMLTGYHLHGSPLPVDVGIVDEAQDCSELQWACVEKMFANCKRIYMAGDDDQAIYPFLGASPYGFLEHACDEEIVLSKSYRCPRAVGIHADSLIKRIAHRKAKTVEWVPKTGGIELMNLDAQDMGWTELQEDYEDIMVLHRHRAGATAFSRELEAIGVPHSIHGESMNSTPEARIALSINALLTGGDITPKQAIILAEALGKSIAPYRDLDPRARVKRVDGVGPMSLSWLIAKSEYGARKRFEAVAQVINTQGIAALTRKPKVHVMTMHASKGKEADLVIISPDCNRTVEMNKHSEQEIKLAYVSLTRAKKEVHLLSPSGDCYMEF